MRVHTGILLAGMLCASLVCAENLTQNNVAKARGIIEKAIDAHGGEAALEALTTLHIEFEGVNIATGQSLKAEPPWDRNPTNGSSAVDLENQAFFTHNVGSGGGFEFNGATIINGENSYQVNYRAGTAAKITEPDFDTASGPFMRVTPALLVRQVRDRAQNAYYLGEVTEGDQAYDVIGFSMAVGPAISLYFEKDGHLLRRSERVLEGFGLVEYRFDDYETIADMPFNRKFTLYLNGDENVVRSNLKIRVNEPIDSLLAVDHGLAEASPVIPDELARRE